MFPLSHPLRFLVVALAGWINQQQREVIEYLQAENRVLREQLGPCQLRFTNDQRIRLAAKAKHQRRRVLRDVATIVSPDTLLRCEHSYEVRAIQGILTGALADLEGGFLSGQEQLVAGVVFDSVLEQARDLVKSGHKDPAAVLVRVVVEDALRRMARAEGINDSGTATRLNDALRDAGRFGKPMWRQIQTWLDVGNAAAHGHFDQYNEATVVQAIDDIGRFWAQEVER